MVGKLLALVISTVLLIGAGMLSYDYYTSTSAHFKPTSNVVEIPSPARQESGFVAPIYKPKPLLATTSITKTTESVSVAPGPLYSTQVEPVKEGVLSVSGVIQETNAARMREGVSNPLTENALLNKDAELKLKDLFARQYFEHISPSGVGPADLAQQVGYSYVIVGENLALGIFEDDYALVDAWMNSVGHRANILNTHYKEIGVAVGKGLYKGQMTWIAVQSFGMPRSACPAIDTVLKGEIDQRNAEIAVGRVNLDAKKALIAGTSPEDPLYNTYIEEYNALIAPYNALVETNREAVAHYNTQIQVFNTCVSAAKTH